MPTARHQQIHGEGISGDQIRDDHAEDGLGQEEGGQGARAVVREEPEVHDEVEAGDDGALEERSEQAPP
jgi:hypothetical protein